MIDWLFRRMQKKNDRRELSGRIWIEGDILHQRSSFSGDWELHISSIHLIGEVTNENGPWGEDWLLIFATAHHEWYEASMAAAGCQSVLEHLMELLECPMETQLVTSTTFASRVLYPKALAGKPALQFIPVKQRFGWLRVPLVRLKFSTEALDFLKDCAN